MPTALSALSGLPVPTQYSAPNDAHQMAQYDHLVSQTHHHPFSTGFQHSPFNGQNFASSMHSFHQGINIVFLVICFAYCFNTYIFLHHQHVEKIMQNLHLINYRKWHQILIIMEKFLTLIGVNLMAIIQCKIIMHHHHRPQIIAQCKVTIQQRQIQIRNIGHSALLIKIINIMLLILYINVLLTIPILLFMFSQYF